MTASVTLLSTRPEFESTWRSICGPLGCAVRTARPDEIAAALRRGVFAILDAATTVYDEDELLTAVGYASSVGATLAIDARSAHFNGLDEVLDDLCAGLVVRDDASAARTARTFFRRLDTTRSERFEFVTLSPRANEILAILGDGRTVLLTRPVADGDNGGEVQSITLAEDARSATLELGDGTRFDLHAASITRVNGGAGRPVGLPASVAALPLDGVRLGARLRELRLEAGLTQAELARRTGIHRPNIARVEAGRHTPSLETLSRLATAIGVSTTRVLSLD